MAANKYDCPGKDKNHFSDVIFRNYKVPGTHKILQVCAKCGWNKKQWGYQETGIYRSLLNELDELIKG